MFLQVSVCPHRGRACVVLLGGRHAWFYSGGMRGFIWVYSGGMHGFIPGVCMVLFGGMWFYLGGMRGFIWGGMCGFIRGCMVLFGGHVLFYLVVCVVFLGAWMVFLGGHAWFFQFFRIQWDTVNERAVCILLECILVLKDCWTTQSVTGLGEREMRAPSLSPISFHFHGVLGKNNAKNRLALLSGVGAFLLRKSWIHH